MTSQPNKEHVVTKYAPNALLPKSTNAADKWIGKAYPPGWCLRFQVVEIFKVPGVGDYDRDRAADAEDYWKAAVAHGKVVKTSDPNNIPPGVMILWTDPSRSDYGHAAYSYGNGWMLSTDLPTSGRVGRVKVSEATRKWGHKLVGYVLVDGNGYTLTKPDPVPEKLPKPVRYRVTAKTGLNGRNGPGTNFKRVWVAPLGRIVVTLAIATGTDGSKWAVNKNGTHYSMDYLEKA